MSARLEIAGIVLKRSGVSWTVGQSVPRMIAGKPTEEVRRPLYASGPRGAISIFLSRVGDVIETNEADPNDAALFHELVKTIRSDVFA